IATPMTNLLSEKNLYQWTPTCQQAFDTLKQRLTSTLILQIWDPVLPTRLETDCSGDTLGAVLLQKHDKHWLPMAYESRRLTPAERNYPIHERELLALVHSLKVWRHYLLDIEFVAKTDHQSIIHLLTQPTISRRQAGWLERIQEHHVDIQYQKGARHIVADALSRIPTSDVQNVTTTVKVEIPWNAEDYGKDKYFAEIFRKTLASKDGTYQVFTMKERMLYCNDRLCVPQTAREAIICEFHDTPTAGHPGRDRTYLLIQPQYYWPHMHSDIAEYVKTCPACQHNKAKRRVEAGLLQPLPIPTGKWESIGIDFIVGLPRTRQGYNAIMTVIDRLSKQAHFIPTTDTLDAPGAARLFIDQIFRLHRMPTSIVSDRDPKFVGIFWQTLMNL